MANETPKEPRRRITDALRAVDGLVDAHLQQAPVDARVLAQLAVTMLIEFSGALRGALLIDDGSGLIARFALGPGLLPASATVAAYDANVVGEATTTRRLVTRGDRLAAPVVLGGRVQGMLYLEAAANGLTAETLELASGVATRIATLLHSARLVEDAARRARNVEVIEAIGAVLSAGVLSDESLTRALRAAVHTTASHTALLAVLDDTGEIVELHTHGEQPEEVRPLATTIAAALAAQASGAAESARGGPALFEVLWADLLPLAASPDRPRRPLGFLLVRGPLAGAYSDADATVFRAIAHLLAGALARLAYFRRAAEDTLTGTGSRLALELAIVESVEQARRSALPLSAILVDVDHFKQINDTYGHQVGDAILRATADRLRARLRARDFVARYGGDEFLLLLPETTSADAVRVAEELRARVAAETHPDHNLQVTLSMGVAAFPEHAESSTELIRRADTALYRSKAEGRNRVSVADAGKETT